MAKIFKLFKSNRDYALEEIEKKQEIKEMKLKEIYELKQKNPEDRGISRLEKDIQELQVRTEFGTLECPDCYKEYGIHVISLKLLGGVPDKKDFLFKCELCDAEKYLLRDLDTRKINPSKIRYGK